MNSLDKRYTPEFWIEDGSYREIYKLYGCYGTLSLREIFEHAEISDADKIWCATRRGVLTRSEMNTALEIIVTRAINNAKSLCISCNEWDAWATKWLSGEDRSWSAANTAAAGNIDDVVVNATHAAYFAARAASATAYDVNYADYANFAADYAAAAVNTARERMAQLHDIINICDGYFLRHQSLFCCRNRASNNNNTRR